MSAATEELTMICPAWCTESHAVPDPGTPNVQHNGPRRTFTAMDGVEYDVDLAALLTPAGAAVDGWGAGVWFDGWGVFSIETAYAMGEFILALAAAAERVQPGT